MRMDIVRRETCDISVCTTQTRACEANVHADATIKTRKNIRQTHIGVVANGRLGHRKERALRGNT